MTDQTAADRGDDATLDTTAADEAAALAAEQAKAGAADTDAQAKTGAEDDTVDADKARDEKGRFIPVDRHKTVLEAERELRAVSERKLAELQTQMAKVSQSADVSKIETEIVALEQARDKAIMDGDTEKSAALAGQIRLKERTIQLQSATDLSNTARAQAAEEVRMDMAITQLESTYPTMDPANEAFDQDLVDLVLASQRNLIENDRMTPAAALVKAASKVMAKLAPAAPAAAEKKGLAAADGAADRKAAQVAKNLDTAKKQPASTKDAGIDSTAAGIQGQVDPSKLSYAEFEALPEATKSRMRGDMVE